MQVLKGRVYIELPYKRLQRQSKCKIKIARVKSMTKNTEKGKKMRQNQNKVSTEVENP